MLHIPSTMLKAMAASLYIVVEGEDPGFDIFVNGHALARNEDTLERLAERLRVHPLLEFFSADENSMALLLEKNSRSGWTLRRSARRSSSSSQPTKIPWRSCSSRGPAT